MRDRKKKRSLSIFEPTVADISEDDTEQSRHMTDGDRTIVRILFGHLGEKQPAARDEADEMIHLSKSVLRTAGHVIAAMVDATPNPKRKYAVQPATISEEDMDRYWPDVYLEDAAS